MLNNFIRNGVAINAAPNGKAEAVTLEDQEKLAKIPEADITAMLGGGGVAFWHTLPYQFAVKAIDLGVPAEMNTPDRRQKWLEIIRLEMLAALGKAENRFCLDGSPPIPSCSELANVRMIETPNISFLT